VKGGIGNNYNSSSKQGLFHEMNILFPLILTLYMDANIFFYFYVIFDKYKCNFSIASTKEINVFSEPFNRYLLNPVSRNFLQKTLSESTFIVAGFSRVCRQPIRGGH
jgi:hypothetical protein